MRDPVKALLQSVARITDQGGVHVMRLAPSGGKSRYWRRMAALAKKARGTNALPIEATDVIWVDELLAQPHM